MTEPPAVLDGARVLYFADISHSKATGRARHYVGGELVEHFDYLAIAQYKGQQPAYVFLCTKEWTVVTDLLFGSPDECLEFVHEEYSRIDLVPRNSI